MDNNKKEAVKEALSVFFNIGPSDIPDEFVSKMKIKCCKKGDYLVRTGEIESYFYFLLKGLDLCRFDGDESERVKWIWNQPGTWLCVMGWLEPIRSIANITIEEDSEVAMIAIQDFRKVADKYPILRRKYMDALYSVNLFKCEEKLMLGKTNVERYRWFLERFPQGMDVIDHYKIASYLGMSPVTLSRIRHKEIEENKKRNGTREL